MSVSTHEALTDIIRESGQVITKGPLNNTYWVEIDDKKWFVRERILADEEYGQTFAAERYVYPSIGHLLNVPRLHRVISSRCKQGDYAMFDYIENIPMDWNDKGIIIKLAEALAKIHSVTSDYVGYVRDFGPVDDYDGAMKNLLYKEIEHFHYSLPGLTSLIARYGTYVHTNVFFSKLDNCLCHGDVHQGNFLMDPANELWVVDWEAARYRSAASDFNQMHYHWLSEEQQNLLIETYCQLTNRNQAEFMQRVLFFRILWHLRTFNFYTQIKNEPEDNHIEQLTTIQEILGRIV